MNTLRLAPGLCFGLWLAAHPARAEPVLDFTCEGLVGYTDNAQSSPDNPVPGVPPKRGDHMLILSPGIGTSWASRRAVSRLGVSSSATLFARNEGADTWSNRLEYRTLAELGPRTSLLVTSSAATTKSQASTLFGPALASELPTTLQGRGTTLAASVEERVTQELTVSTSGYEALAFVHGRSLFVDDAPATSSASGRVGLDRSFRVDALGFEWSEEYAVFRASPGGTDSEQLVTRGVAIHRRDYGRYVVSRLEAGAERVDRLRSGRSLLRPTAVLRVVYEERWGRLEASASHRATTSVELGQSLFLDEVRLAGAFPLIGERTLLLEGDVGYARGRVIEEDGTAGARLDITFVDLALASRLSPAVTLGNRFQSTRQLSDATAPPAPLSFRRNSVFLFLSVRWPPELEPLRPIRTPLRVDASDDARRRRSRGE